MGTATGLMGALAVGSILKNLDFPTSYVVIFSAAAVLIFISWVFLAQTREPAQISDKGPVSKRDYWRGLPKVLQRDRNFRHYLVSRVTITLSGMAVGFLIVYAVDRWSLSDGQAGLFTTALLVGQAAFYLFFGFVADRKGHKLVLEMSVLCSAAAVGLAFIAPNASWFYPVFALIGGSIAGYILSGISIAFEFSPADIRPTYIGLNNTINGCAAIISPLLGAILATTVGYQGLFMVAFLIGLLGFGLMHWWVVEPRDLQIVIEK